MKGHPKLHFFIPVILLARRGEKKQQIMEKEDQLNPFQFNSAGAMVNSGVSDTKLKSMKCLSL